MIDKATVERRMRDANPIRGIDDVDPDELAYAVAAAHTRRAAVMQAPTQHPTSAIPVTPTPQRRRLLRSAWVFGAAFILVAVVIGVAALLTRDREAPVADESSPVTTAETAPAPSVGESAAPLGLTWARAHQDPEVFREALVLDMTAGRTGLVAVGLIHEWAITPELGETRAMVWTSTSGETWSRIPYDEVLVGEDSAASKMEGVTVGGPGFVAVGSHGGAFTVWTSTNGEDWTPVFSDPRAAIGDDSETLGVVAGGAGFVAYAHVAGRVVLWLSPDGLEWSRVADDSESFGSSQIIDMAAGGPGFVAVGVDELGFVDAAPPVWTSPDGYSWTRGVDSDAFSRQSVDWRINSVAAWGPGFVAVGEEQIADGVRAVVWTSPDGYSWTRIPHDDSVFGGPGEVNQMLSVAAAADGLVAVGSEFQAIAWTSRDGITWTRTYVGALAEAQSLRHVVATDSVFVANGFENHPDTAICIGTVQDSS